MFVSARQGILDGRGLRIGIVVARFNEEITTRLYESALRGLYEMGVQKDGIVGVTVPGAVEIPLAAQTLVKHQRVDAVVALGAVIRGETSHYDYVCSMVADGCLRVSLDHGLPVAFGVLTCDTVEQAEARSGPRETNKGFEAACVAIEMATLQRGLRT
jgi:6,7-dimethyl-8-ribityllumazine synthase